MLYILVINMLSGFGNQQWMKKTYETTRRKIMLDREGYSDEDLEEYECTRIDLGGGMTDSSNYKIKQYPYPIDHKIRSRKTLDIREVDPRIGD